ncbi:apolipoprotein N-acyltransferase [Defluviimonas sp. D31]|uniref:apolipoprotein N-acyltransferase n=1 Tax=Defluviimonas sp. D31 TaxID=3083253 RepID=UPI00296E4555|nr:apolipoprotein N-acyltransferase [Defluviimonas sp. D31]MDW4550818.1 apolipoprotein N-acyltransferase [Defluviimonas sp. D31]
MTQTGRQTGRAARPAIRRLALAAALGAGVATGQAPWDLWWIALPALGALTALIAAEVRGPRLVWLGWIGGAGYFAAGLFWIVEPFQVDAARDAWMAPFALVFMAFGMALFWALAGGVAALGRGPATRAAGFALGLVATDLLRGYVFTGFPWALVGHVWIGTPVMQAAAFVGPVGLSALATFAAALPMLGRRPAARAGLAALAALAIGAVWAGGTVRLAAPEPQRDSPIRVRLIQPNAAQALKWRGDMWRIFLDRQMAQTAAPAAAPLDLVVWPETAVPFLLEDAGGLFSQIAEASGGVPAAVGIQRVEGMRYFNSLAAADGSGEVHAVYDKWHLVPFGEYIPYGDVMAEFGISAFAAREGNGYSPGPGAQVLDLGRAGKVLPLICYEAVFPQDLRAAPERADWVLQVTNDAWFGNVAGPYQHFAQGRLRAVEQGLPLLRAANTGVTAVIDAKGRVLDSLPLNTEGVLDAEVPAALAPTPYARTGDLPAAFLIGIGLLALAATRRRVSD